MTIISGVMDIEAVEQAMRSFSTNVLTGTTDKKKVYPTNYVNSDDEEQNNEETQYGQPSYLAQYDDEEVTNEYIENLAASGDGALPVQGFERDLTDLFQDSTRPSLPIKKPVVELQNVAKAEGSGR